MNPPAREELHRRLESVEAEARQLRRALDLEDGELPLGAFSILEVGVAGLPFALPVDVVCEVTPMLWVEPLAGAPDWLLGTFSYAGQEVVMVDVQLRLTGEAATLDSSMWAILVRAPGLCGLAVTSLGDTRLVPAGHFSAPPATATWTPFVRGSRASGDGGVIHLLSVERLCGDAPFPG